MQKKDFSNQIMQKTQNLKKEEEKKPSWESK